MKTQTISSRDNAHIKTIRRLAQTSNSYQDAGFIWLEGEHLCHAFLQATMPKLQLQKIVLAASAKPGWIERVSQQTASNKVSLTCEAVLLSDSLFAHISALPSSGGVGFVLAVPEQVIGIQKSAHTLVLDRVQDAGNVGSMLRSAAAFGVTQILALQGTALVWSPKVVRAAMGAHFSLHVIEGLDQSDIQLNVPLVATDVHGGALLHELQLAGDIPHPCAWVMGHEGGGVSQVLMDKALLRVNIQQRGQESLNVAAAAAVCLYASMPHS